LLRETNGLSAFGALGVNAARIDPMAFRNGQCPTAEAVTGAGPEAVSMLNI
jgi:hypothetical protein